MSIYTNRVQAPVERQPLTGFDKPLQNFKELSTKELAEKEKERADGIAADEKEIQESAARNEKIRKQAEEERKRQEKAAKEDRERYLSMSEKVDAPDNMKMYGSHYAMLEELAQHLANPDIIKEYASSVEGEMEYNALIEQLLTLTDTFEGYYKETYGDYENDDLGAPTLQAAEKRHREGASMSDRTFDTPYEEMKARFLRLEEKAHEKMEVRGGRVVFIDSEGNEIIPGEDMLDLNVFQTEVSERAPLDGGQYIATVFDPQLMSSPQSVRSHLERILEQNPTVMQDASRHYVETQMDQNPDFARTAEEVAADPDLRLAAQELYIKEATEEAAKRQRDLASIPTGNTQEDTEEEPSDEEKIGEAQEQEQAMNQDPGLPTPEEIDTTITEEDAVEEMAQNLGREIGREITEEEKEMLFSPEAQAMLRAAGFSSVDMTRFFPEDPRSRGAQPTSGLEDVNISGQTEVTPRQAQVSQQPTEEDVQAFAQDMGLNIREVSMDMFKPDTPLADAFRQWNTERSRIKSLVDQQRALNAERNQQMSDDFGGQFSGGLQEALSNYGKDQEVQDDRTRKVLEEFSGQFDNVNHLVDSLDMGYGGGGATVEGEKKIAKIEAENEEIRRRNAEINAQNEEIRKKREEYENKFTDKQKPLFLDEDSLRVNEAGAVKSGLNVKTERGYVDDQGQPYGGSISRVSFDPMEMSWNVDLTVNGQLIKVPISMSEDGKIDVSTDAIPGVTNRAGRKVTYFEIIQEAFNSNYGSKVDGSDTFASFLIYLAQRALE